MATDEKYTGPTTAELDATRGQDERLVLLASYSTLEEADKVKELLQSDGIYCSLRNAYSYQMTGGMVDLGGVRIEIPSYEVEHALAVLASAGISLPDPSDSTVGKIGQLAERLPIGKGLPLEKRLWRLIFLLGLALLLLALAFTLVVEG